MCLLRHIAPICPFNTAVSSHFSEMSLHWTFPVFHFSAKHFPKCWQQEWRMYSAAPKTVADSTQMLIYVCKMGAADLAKVGTDDESYKFLRPQQSFQNSLWVLLPGICLNIFSGPCRGNNNSVSTSCTVPVPDALGFLRIAWLYLAANPPPVPLFAFLPVWMANAADRTILHALWSMEQVRLLEFGSTQHLKENVHENKTTRAMFSSEIARMQFFL